VDFQLLIGSVRSADAFAGRSADAFAGRSADAFAGRSADAFAGRSADAFAGNTRHPREETPKVKTYRYT